MTVNPTIKVMTTRRRFLTGCSVLTATVALNPSTLLSAAAVRNAVAASLPGLTTFARQVGTTFQVARTGDSAVSLRLEEANPLPTPTAEWGEFQFALLFRGPADRCLGQDTHRLEHATLGRLELFLVPVRLPQGAHQYYEAIFNQYPGPLV
jgi:hypothetical protein